MPPTAPPQPIDLAPPATAGEGADRDAEAARFAGCSLFAELYAIKEVTK